MAIKVLNEFLPEAEQIRLGGVKVGDTLSINNGVGGNRLTAISRHFKLSISNNTLTLAKGGKVFIPRGFESDETTKHFDEYVLTKDYTRGDTLDQVNTQYMVSFSADEDTIKLRPLSATFSGAIQPTGQGFYFWYDTANNILKAYTNGALDSSEGCTLPLGIIKTDANGKIASGINVHGIQWFDAAFGYIGNEVFCLPGVHGTYPYGFETEEYTPRSIGFTVDRVLTTTVTNPYSRGKIYLNGTELIVAENIIYHTGGNTNRVVDTNTAIYAADTNSYVQVGTSRIDAIGAGRIYGTAYENPQNEGRTYYQIRTQWLTANNGYAINNSINASGSMVPFDRYKSQNGVFLACGYQKSFRITYTSDATINANQNAITKEVILLDEDGNAHFPGNIAAVGNVEATASTALWADLAEKYESDAKYPIGTLIVFDGEKEITIAKKSVNGVISEKPGYTLNSKSKGQPVALVGRVKVRVIGKVNKNDKLVLYKDGLARKKKWYDVFKTVIGITLESNNSNDEKLIMSVVRLAI